MLPSNDVWSNVSNIQYKLKILLGRLYNRISCIVHEPSYCFGSALCACILRNNTSCCEKIKNKTIHILYVAFSIEIQHFMIYSNDVNQCKMIGYKLIRHI